MTSRDITDIFCGEKGFMSKFGYPELKGQTAFIILATLWLTF